VGLGLGRGARSPPARAGVAVAEAQIPWGGAVAAADAGVSGAAPAVGDAVVSGVVEAGVPGADGRGGRGWGTAWAEASSRVSAAFEGEERDGGGVREIVEAVAAGTREGQRRAGGAGASERQLRDESEERGDGEAEGGQFESREDGEGEDAAVSALVSAGVLKGSNHEAGFRIGRCIQPTTGCTRSS
jgi:hypothetical protein